MGVSIQNLTRLRTASRSVFLNIAKEVLTDWEISLVFVTPAKALSLNKQLRGKTYIPNVLSYEVGDKSGEIFICLDEAKKQAPLHKKSEKEFVLALFIHGLLHIKGWAHGAKMERCEQELLTKYVATNSDRNRHRHVPDKNGRGRRNHR